MILTITSTAGIHHFLIFRIITINTTTIIISIITAKTKDTFPKENPLPSQDHQIIIEKTNERKGTIPLKRGKTSLRKDPIPQ